CVGGRHVVRVELRAGGRPDARDLEGILHRHREPVEQTEGLSPGERAVGAIGSGARAFGVERHDGVDARVQSLDAVEVVVEALAAPDVATAKRGDGVDGRTKYEI